MGNSSGYFLTPSLRGERLVSILVGCQGLSLHILILTKKWTYVYEKPVDLLIWGILKFVFKRCSRKIGPVCVKIVLICWLNVEFDDKKQIIFKQPSKFSCWFVDWRKNTWKNSILNQIQTKNWTYMCQNAVDLLMHKRILTIPALKLHICGKILLICWFPKYFLAQPNS